MPTLEELLKSNDPESLKKLQDFILGKSGDPTSPISREAIQSFKIQKALETNPAELVGESYIPKDRFTQAVERLEPSVKMVSETPDISSKLQSIDKAPAQAAKDKLLRNVMSSSETPDISSKLAQTDEIASKAKFDDIAKRLEALPDEQLSKFGKLGEFIKNSRLGQSAGPILGAAGIAALTPEAIQESERALDSDESGLQRVASGLKSAGKSAQMASIPVGMIGSPIAGGLTALGGMGVESIGEAAQSLEESRKSFQDPKNIQAIRELGEGLVGKDDSWKQYFDPSKFAQDEQPEKPQLDVPSGDQTFSESEGSEIEAPAPVEMPSAAQQALLEQGFTNATVQNLMEAQKAANQNRLIANIMQGTGQIGAGIAGLGAKSQVKPIDFKNLLENADVPVEQFKQQVETEKKDPNSQYSVGFRNFAKPIIKQLGIDESLVEKMSGEQLGSLIPQLRSMYNEKVEGEYKKQALAEAAKLRKASEEEKKEDKKTKNDNDWIFNASKSVKGIADSYSKIYGAAESVKSMTGKNPAEDVAVLYDFVKTLDPNSAVREGEVGLARSMASLKGKAEVLFNSVTKGDVIDKKTVDNLKKEILRLEQTGKKTYDQRMEPFRKQAKARGLEGRVEEFDPFYQSKSLESSPSINKDVQDYANEHFKGNYQAAEAYLKFKGLIK